MTVAIVALVALLSLALIRIRRVTSKLELSQEWEETWRATADVRLRLLADSHDTNARILRALEECADTKFN